MLPVVVRVEDLEKKTSVHHVFRTSPVHIGRNDLNDLPLAHPFVSMWHGMLRFDEFSVEYTDLNSTNGSEVNGQQAKKNVFIPVDEKTDLRIGNLRLHIARQSESTAPEPAHSQTQFRLMKSVLEPGSPAPARAAAPSAPAPRVPPEGVKKPPRRDVTPEEDRFREIGGELLPLYTQYRQDWRTLVDRLVEKLDAVPANQWAALFEALTPRMSAIQQEEQFRSLAERVGVQLKLGKRSESDLATTDIAFPPASQLGEPPAQRRTMFDQTLLEPPQISGRWATTGDASGEVGAVALSQLRLFAQTYGSDEHALQSAGEVELLLNQMAAVLETFSMAFVELRRGVDQFVEEMAVQTATSLNPLQRAKTPSELLRHLLDVESDSESEKRLKALTSGFAQVMIHQVALLSGIREGMRALLARLSPQELEHRDSGDMVFLGNVSALLRLPIRYIARKVWPFRVFRLWHQYRRVYSELEEERQLQSAVFGPEFAHAYVMMVSGRPPDSGERRPDQSKPPASHRGRA